MLRPALIAAFALGLSMSSAEAARCAKGKIYRPSVGVCQDRAQAARQGVRIKSRATKRRPVQRARKPPVRAHVTYKQHLWNWVEANRDELIRSYRQ